MPQELDFSLQIQTFVIDKDIISQIILVKRLEIANEAVSGSEKITVSLDLLLCFAKMQNKTKTNPQFWCNTIGSFSNNLHMDRILPFVKMKDALFSGDQLSI